MIGSGDYIKSIHKKRLTKLKKTVLSRVNFVYVMQGQKGISSVLRRLIRPIELGEQFKHVPLNPYSITAIGCDVGFAVAIPQLWLLNS